MENISSKSVSVRLPLHLYRWLENLTGPGRDYPNMNQAVIGELTCIKAEKELRERETLSPRARRTDITE
jgi:Arc/MetJ-type ribon-helix-helix transcriptional regulator